MDHFNKLRKEFIDSLFKKQVEHNEVLTSKQYTDSTQFLNSYTFDFIDAIRMISFYSTRWKGYYDESLVIHSIDDCIQSAIAIKFQIENGIFNPAKRELRYMIELAAKSLYVDQVKGKDPLKEKINYLHAEVPRSSIDFADRLILPFEEIKNKEFLDDLSLYYSQVCEYVHPSKKQIDEQVANYGRGNTIGFETAKMLDSVTKLTFKFYDLILVLFFTGFGPSMSKDLFEAIFGENEKWKFHKGRHTMRYFTKKENPGVN